MLDLDAIEARVEAELSYAWEERVKALVAELRAAREVVEAGAALMATYEPTWDGRSLRTPEVAACRAAVAAYRAVVGEQG